MHPALILLSKKQLKGLLWLASNQVINKNLQTLFEMNDRLTTGEQKFLSKKRVVTTERSEGVLFECI